MRKTKSRKDRKLRDFPVAIQNVAAAIWVDIRNHVDYVSNGRLDSERYTRIIAEYVQEHIAKSVKELRRQVKESKHQLACRNAEIKRLKGRMLELNAEMQSLQSPQPGLVNPEP